MPSADANHHATLNGLSLHYETWGDQSAPPLVLVHGLRAFGRWFHALGDAFGEDYYLIAPDLRGRNLSSWAPDGDYRIESYIQDLAALADHLGLQRFALAGHSLGGRIATAFTAAHPERVGALILLDSSPEPHPAGMARIRAEVQRMPPHFASRDAAAQFLHSLHPKASPADIEIRLACMLRETAPGIIEWSIDPACTRQPPGDPALAWATLGAVTAPTLILRATGSDVLSELVHQRMLAACPGAEAAYVADAGHMVLEDNPSGTARAMADFLKAHYPAP
jgi:esterase